MTFTVPEDVAGQLVHRIPARDRSRYVSHAIADKLREREQRLIRACEMAGGDAELLTMERDWAAPNEQVRNHQLLARSKRL
jgi:hypothetical protein